METERSMKPQDRSQVQSSERTALRGGVPEGTLGTVADSLLSAQRLRPWRAPGQPSTGPRILGKFSSGHHSDMTLWQPSHEPVPFFCTVS